MTQEIVDAVKMLEQEKGIASDTLMDALQDALLSAYKKTPGAAKYAKVELDHGTADFRVYELIVPEDLEKRLLDEQFEDQLQAAEAAEAAGEPIPEVEIDDTDIPESTGADSFLEWLARWDQVWESWHIEDLEVRAAGDDQAIALFKMVAKGKGSGVELTRRDALVASFRGGKAVKLGYYNDQTQALEAVGLRE